MPTTAEWLVIGFSVITILLIPYVNRVGDKIGAGKKR